MHERGVIFGDDVACQLQQLLLHRLATLHQPQGHQISNSMYFVHWRPRERRSQQGWRCARTLRAVHGVTRLLGVGDTTRTLSPAGVTI